MSKPTGTSAELLQLPSGGGAVTAASAGFNVDQNTGTGAATFQLVLPTGPNGIRPPLSLTYATTSGSGPFGMGWSLGLATVLRKITPVIGPQDQTSPGTYSLVGAGDLLDMGAGRYRPVVDATGMLIEFDGNSWTLTDNHDTSYTLGTTANARIGSSPPAAWLLDSSADSQGNKITYKWRNDGGGCVPDTISWGTYQVVFQYEERPDLIVNGQFGVPITSTLRCSSIELHVTTESQSLVRSWDIIYDDNDGRGRSLLSAIREQGHAADGSILAAPDRTFAYTELSPPILVPVTGWTAPLDDPNTDLVDLDGDGLPDLLQLGAGLPSKRANLGAGKFGFPRAYQRAPAPLTLGSANVAFADMSGAGNLDLLFLGQPLAGYYPLSVPQGGAAPATFGLPVTFTNAPGVVPADPRVRFLDLNGDGMTDVLFDTGRSWLAFLREGTDSWLTPPWVLSSNITPPVDLADPHVYLADMNGDGITDIVRITGGIVSYWPGRADGGWGSEIRMTPSPNFGIDYDPRRMNVVDIDGDGCGDLVYVGSISVTVWRNVGAAQLADPMVVDHTPLAQPGSYRILDLLGTGAPGVLFQLPQLQGGGSRQTFLDLSGGVKPYLLSDFTNGPCLSTHITYRTSTSYAIDDAQAEAPWLTYHPFPIQCVARIDQTDHATGLVTSSVYTYHSARYDPATHTFLGFARVECDQLGDETCPTLRTQTTFHVGLDPSDPSKLLFGDDALKQGALRRRVLSVATYGLDGTDLAANPYSISLHTYDALLVPSGLGDGNQIAVPYMTSTAEQRWERHASPVSARLTEILAINDEGDVTLQRTRATRAGIASADQDVTTAATFATGGHNLRLPARITQTAPDGTVIAVTVTYYDGGAFVGLPEGQATQGLITRVERRAFDDTFATSIWGSAQPSLTTYGYHRQPGDLTGWWFNDQTFQRNTGSSGPTLSTQNALGGIQRMQYDSAGQRVIAVTDAVGNTVTATVNPRIWQTQSVTDPNGHTVTDSFDPLGRVLATVGPLDSDTDPTWSFAYNVGPLCSVVSEARIAHGASAVLAATTWLGGSGQVLGRTTPSAIPGQWIISQAITLNIRNLPIAAYLPYAVASSEWQTPPPGTAATVSRYDALGRSIMLTRTDGLITTTRRNGDTITISEQWPGGAAADVEQHVYDAAGQLIAVSRNAGDHWVTQSYSYDPSGKVKQVTLPDGTNVVLENDLLGRRFSQQSPDAGRTVYLIDACHNERLRINPTGQQLVRTVDAANRPTSTSYGTGAQPQVTYEYLDQDGAAPPDGITVNRFARVWRITDELGTIILEYNEAGVVTSRTRTVAATGQTFIEQVAYDALGRTTSVTLPTTAGVAARTVEYEYGADGLPASASGIISQATHDLFGRLTSLAYANGTGALFDYGPNGGRLSRIRVSDSGGTLIRDTTVTRNRAFVTAVSSALADDDSAAFSYDGMRRLTVANYSNGSTTLDDHAWSYDDCFRIVSDSDAGALSYRAGTHQLASVAGQAMTYDAAGRLTASSYGTVVFDAADHLTSVNQSNGTVISHVYDYRGCRARSLSGSTQTYLMPLNNVEIQGGIRVSWISFGTLRVAADVDGTLWFLHPNALSATDLITDVAGKYSTRVRQTPFGLTRPNGAAPPAGASAALVLLLIGADSTGLICQGLRWYDPRLGQFISPDPVIPGVFIIGAWNPYIYCLGNPIALWDPSGCNFLTDIGVALVAAVCVVGAIFTGGASLFGLAAMLSSTSLAFMGGVAVGTFGAAVAGALSAQNAGGNIWEGAFVGALIGGVTSLAGGALGALVANAINNVVTNAAITTATATAEAGNVAPSIFDFVEHVSVWSFIVGGLTQGAIAGAGTGLAIGFAGGKGSAEAMLNSMAKGALWGGALGGLTGAGLGLLYTTNSNYLNFFNITEKFGQGGSFKNAVNSVDNTANGIQSVAQFSVPGGGGFNFSNVAGFMTNFVSSGSSAGGLFSISISGLDGVLTNAGLAATVNVSMAADQLGFSYAEQLVALSGAVTIWDLIVAQMQLSDPSYLNSVEKGLNTKLDSGNPNDV
jgi:RHS repeat-associated protein